ncbi:MAG: efflux RND transporter periplasmic adaptor subunit [Deltaproteobacteria bacterium]
MPEAPRATRRSPWPLYLIGLLSCLLAFGGAFIFSAAKQAALAQEGASRRELVLAGPRVLVAQVKTTPIDRTVALPGEIHPFNQAVLYAKISGYLRQIRVDKGDLVHRGELLGVIESPETDQQVASARATYANAVLVAKRSRELLARKLVAQQETDLADAQEKTAKAALDQALALKSYETIRAPFGGRITARYADPGNLLQAATGSAASALPLVELQEVGRLRIYVYLGQDDAQLVRQGDPCELVSDDHPDQPISASVTRMAGALDPRTRTMLTEIDVDNHAGLILPGGFVHARLKLHGRPFPVLPSEALVSRGDKLFAVVVTNDHAHFVEIETGEDNGTSIEIRRGLKGGEWVALNVSTDLEDGAAVQPVAPSGS